MKKSTFLHLIVVFLLGSTKLSWAQNDIATVIQSHLSEYHDEMGLSLSDVSDWTITNNINSKKQGIRNVHIAQTINGISIKNGVANFTLNSENEVVFVGDRLLRDIQGKTSGPSDPGLTPEQAIQRAASHTKMNGTPGALLESAGPNQFTYDKGTLSNEVITVDLHYLHKENSLRLAWAVSLYQLDQEHWWNIYVDANTGDEIERVDWVVHCNFGSNIHSGCAHAANPTAGVDLDVAPPPAGGGTSGYRVYPLPIESPNHGERAMVYNPEYVTASPFGWHDTDGVAGAEYTITRGNNVHAYDDQGNNNAPGTSPDGTGTLTFDFPLSSADQPNTYLPAAITNLFYTNNMMHDIWYNYGFDEESGNFQTNNYGNLGEDDDHVLAEAQDGSGTNNANFATPPDGLNPRMQMYVWTGSSGGDLLTVNSPAGISGAYNAAEAEFGPDLPSTPITADIALYEDATAPINDACQEATNAAQLNGKIVILDRGECSFVSKVLSAQNAGALAVIVVNNVAGSPITMGGSDGAITIPSIMISQADGTAIKSALAIGTVNASISNGGISNVDRDSDLDNGIIAHEYGHGISTRLTGGPSNSNCLGNAEQMGEGWSDWFGLMLTIEPGDQAADIRGIGTYADGQGVLDQGIRPAPYSTDFGINGFTYGASNNTSEISQPHGVGFIFATVLWDLTWALIDEYGGTPDPDLIEGSGGNNIAMNLVMTGLKLQPCSPGMIDGRDAILAADQLLYGGAHECLIWNVFANRGFGYSADQGSSSSRTDQTEAFDLPSICDIAIVAPEAAFSASADTICSPFISFTDESTDIPQAWLWDFGDGNTSTEMNPTHEYAANGVYTVQLTVSNTIGSDDASQTVVVNMPAAPSVSDVVVCSGATALVTGTTDANSRWRNAADEIVHIGDTLTVANVTTVQNFTVENLDVGSSLFVGPDSSNFGSGGYHGTTHHGAQNFTTEQPLVIVSAWVDADGPGPRTIILGTGINSGTTPTGANVVSSIEVDMIDGPQRVDLNMVVPAAGEYNIGCTNANLYRNNVGATYPYDLPGYMSINSSSAVSDQDFYYYLYDLEVASICTSPQTTVTVEPFSTPVINCPGIQYATVDSSCNNSLADYTSLLVEANSCAPTVQQVPAPGTLINSNTLVTLIATDGVGNTDSCSFEVRLAPEITHFSSRFTDQWRVNWEYSAATPNDTNFRIRAWESGFPLAYTDKSQFPGNFQKKFTGLDDNTWYHVKVGFACADGSFIWGGTDSVKTKKVPCPDVTGHMQQLPLEEHKATLTWDDNGAASYKLRFRSSGTSSWSYRTVTGTSKTLAGLIPATLYEYQIKALCANGLQSSYGEVHNFNTGSISVERLSASAVDGFSIYPNPSDGNITLELSTEEVQGLITLTDVAGRTVYSESIMLGPNFRKSFNFDLESGTYLLRVIADDLMETRKLEIQ